MNYYLWHLFAYWAFTPAKKMITTIPKKLLVNGRI
jgi:hypothetical protein